MHSISLLLTHTQQKLTAVSWRKMAKHKTNFNHFAPNFLSVVITRCWVICYALITNNKLRQNSFSLVCVCVSVWVVLFQFVRGMHNVPVGESSQQLVVVVYSVSRLLAQSHIEMMIALRCEMCTLVESQGWKLKLVETNVLHVIILFKNLLSAKLLFIIRKFKWQNCLVAG